MDPIGSSTHPTYQSSPRPNMDDDTVWEIALERLSDAYFSEEEGLSLGGVKIEIAESLEPSIGATVQQANQLIEKLWNAAAEEPASSSTPLIESVFLKAVEAFRHRVPRNVGGPSYTQQQRFLLSDLKELGSSSSAIEIIKDWNPDDPRAEQIKNRLSDLLPGADPRAQKRLVAIVKDLFQKDPELAAAVVAEKDLSQAIQKGAPIHSEILLEKMDKEVQAFLQSETALLDPPCPDKTVQEDPEARAKMLEKYRHDWKRCSDQIRKNLPFRTRGQMLSDKERATRYNQYLNGLMQAWAHHRDERPWRVLETLPLFLEDCETGWDGQISALLNAPDGPQDLTSAETSPVMTPLLAARNKRRAIVDEHFSTFVLGANPHYEHALKQTINQSIAGGWHADEIGDPEKEVILEAVREMANNTVEAIRQSEVDGLHEVISCWRSMRESEREQVLTYLRQRFAEALQEGAPPIFLSTEELRQMEVFQQDLVKAIEKSDINLILGVLKQAPISALTGAFLLEEDRTDQLKSLARQGRLEELKQIARSLTEDAELRAFDLACASTSDPSKPLAFLWADYLGLIEVRDPRWQRLLRAMTPMEARLTTQEQSALNKLSQGSYVLSPLEWRLLAAIPKAKQILLERLQTDPPLSLGYILGPLRRDRDLNVAAITHHGWQHQHLPQELLDDPDLAILALEHDTSSAWENFSQALKRNREVCKRAVQKDPSIWTSIKWEFQKDPEICAAAVAGDGGMLKEVRANVPESNLPEIVKIAINQNPLALKWADYLPDEVYREVCHEACALNPVALRYVPEEYRGFDLVLSCVQRDWRVFGYVKGQLKENPEIKRAADEGAAGRPALTAFELSKLAWI